MAAPVQPAYTYAAEIVRWIDGDTVDVKVDVGFYITSEVRLRLFGLDTPERGSVNYREAWMKARQLAPSGAKVVVKTYKVADKYGRFLADIYAGDAFINNVLIEQGLAKPYFGGTKS